MTTPSNFDEKLSNALAQLYMAGGVDDSMTEAVNEAEVAIKTAIARLPEMQDGKTAGLQGFSGHDMRILNAFRTQLRTAVGLVQLSKAPDQSKLTPDLVNVEGKIDTSPDVPGELERLNKIIESVDLLTIMDEEGLDYDGSRYHAASQIDDLISAATQSAEARGYRKGYTDAERPVYYLAHDILADKRIPRHEALAEFDRRLAALQPQSLADEGNSENLKGII